MPLYLKEWEKEKKEKKKKRMDIALLALMCHRDR
jgi:hypothetical protein